jgi:hypothetical protein
MVVSTKESIPGWEIYTLYTKDAKPVMVGKNSLCRCTEVHPITHTRCKTEIRRDQFDPKVPCSHDFADLRKISGFFIPKKQENVGEKQKEQEFVGSLNVKLRKKLALLSGQDGFSFEQVASGNLWSIVYECMEEMNRDLPDEYRKDPRSLVHPPTGKQVSQYVNEEGPKEKKAIYKRNASAHRSCTLTCDSGQFGGVSYFAIAMYFPAYPEEPPTVLLFRKGISTQDEMAEAFAEILLEVTAEGIDVDDVVVDGLFRQKNALTQFPSPSSTKSNYQDYLPAEFKHPLPFLLPDIPHLFALSLTQTRDDPHFQLGRYVEAINAICHELRKAQATTEIGRRCPLYSPTRFFHIVLELLFINKYNDAIVGYYNRLFIYLFIYYPLYCSFSDSATSAWKTYRLFTKPWQLFQTCFVFSNLCF